MGDHLKSIHVEAETGQVGPDGSVVFVDGPGDAYAASLRIASVEDRRVGVWFLAPDVQPAAYAQQPDAVVFVRDAHVHSDETRVVVDDPEDIGPMEAAAVAAVLADSGLFSKSTWTFRIKTRTGGYTVELSIDPDNYGSFWNCEVTTD